MADQNLELIEQIARLRRHITSDVKDLRARVSSARIEKKSRLGFMVQTRFDPVRATFLGENMKQQAEVYADLTEWLRDFAERSKSYDASIAAVSAADRASVLSQLSTIKDSCEHEIDVKIPQLRQLVDSIEALKRSYDEFVKR